MQYKYLILFVVFPISLSYSQNTIKKGITIYEYSDDQTPLKIKPNFIIPEELDELEKGVYKVTLAIQKDCTLKVQSVRKNQNQVGQEIFEVFQKTFSKIPLHLYCNDQPVTFSEYQSFVLIVTLDED